MERVEKQPKRVRAPSYSPVSFPSCSLNHDIYCNPANTKRGFIAQARCFQRVFFPRLIENEIQMKNKFSQFHLRDENYFNVTTREKRFSTHIQTLGDFAFINLNVAWNGKTKSLLYDTVDPQAKDRKKTKENLS